MKGRAATDERAAASALRLAAALYGLWLVCLVVMAIIQKVR